MGILLVFANKQDLPNAVAAAELTEQLSLPSLRNRKWYIQACVGTTGEGLYEGLDWLAAEIAHMHANKQRGVEVVVRRTQQRKREDEEKKKGLPLCGTDEAACPYVNAIEMDARWKGWKERKGEKLGR